MPHIVETDRLIIRPWTTTDAEALLELCGDAEVMRFIGSGEPYRRKFAPSLMAQHVASQRVLEKLGFTCKGPRRFDEAEDMYYVATRRAHADSQ